MRPPNIMTLNMKITNRRRNPFTRLPRFRQCHSKIDCHHYNLLHSHLNYNQKLISNNNSLTTRYTRNHIRHNYLQHPQPLHRDRNSFERVSKSGHMQRPSFSTLNLPNRRPTNLISNSRYDNRTPHIHTTYSTLINGTANAIKSSIR